MAQECPALHGEHLFAMVPTMLRTDHTDALDVARQELLRCELAGDEIGARGMAEVIEAIRCRRAERSSEPRR